MSSNTPVPTASPTAHLRALDLHLARGGRVLLRGVDLTLALGDRLAVVGENGRGKSTLLEALSGDLIPDAGTVERHGSLGAVRQELVVADDDHRTVGDLLDELLARPLGAVRELDEAAEVWSWQETRRRRRAAWEDAYRAQQDQRDRLHARAETARSRLSTGWRPDKGTGRHQRQSRAPGVVRALNERIDQLQEHRLEVPSPPPRLSLPSSSTAPGTPLLRADRVRVDRVDATGTAPATGLPPRLAETTLRLEGGDRLLVVGPNGAGKTALLQVLAAELAPSAGTVRRLGRAHIGMLAQEGQGDAAASSRHRGSPGERRRRELAALFAGRPDVLLLDEPTNHLGISGVDDLLSALEGSPAAIVLATHDRSVLRALGHWPRLELGG